MIFKNIYPSGIDIFLQHNPNILSKRDFSFAAFKYNNASKMLICKKLKSFNEESSVRDNGRCKKTECMN